MPAFVRTCSASRSAPTRRPEAFGLEAARLRQQPFARHRVNGEYGLWRKLGARAQFTRPRSLFRRSHFSIGRHPWNFWLLYAALLTLEAIAVLLLFLLALLLKLLAILKLFRVMTWPSARGFGALIADHNEQTDWLLDAAVSD
jgi:hypothetical protein